MDGYQTGCFNVVVGTCSVTRSPKGSEKHNEHPANQRFWNSHSSWALEPKSGDPYVHVVFGAPNNGTASQAGHHLDLLLFHHFLHSEELLTCLTDGDCAQNAMPRELRWGTAGFPVTCTLLRPFWLSASSSIS